MTIRRELEASPLLELDLAAESERFLAAIKAAGVKHARNPQGHRDKAVAAVRLLRASGLDMGNILRCRLFRKPLAGSLKGSRTTKSRSEQPRRIADSVDRAREVACLAQGGDRPDQFADRERRARPS